METESNGKEDGIENSTVKDSKLNNQNVENRPKRGSTVVFQKVGESNESCGKVKFVCKASGNKKNTFWVEIDGNLTEIDFMKIFQAGLIQKSHLEFNSPKLIF